jgi:hypothetical protein
MAIDTTIPRSRRALLTGLSGAIAALAAQALGRPLPALAEGETMHVGGDYFDATSATQLKNTTTDNDVLIVSTTKGGHAVYGKSTKGIGVAGVSTSFLGVRGFSTTWHGVFGSSDSSVGVRGLSGSGTGVHATSTSGDAVRGESTDGRGGRFAGKTAQVQLVPSAATTHPAAPSVTCSSTPLAGSGSARAARPG